MGLCQQSDISAFISYPLPASIDVKHATYKHQKVKIFSFFLKNPKFPCFCSYFFLNFLGVYLLYNVVFLPYSKVNQLYVCVSPVFWISFSFRSPLSKASVLYSRFSLVFCFIHSSVYISV